MIGDNAEINSIFKARINTQRLAKIIHEHIDTDDDYVTSRILWLTGEEPGKNSGVGIDSYSRYIYIHGTQEEGLIGSKASHGCIRMFNNDVVSLYKIVKKGTKVNILI
jgi:lipoprotein-anchoring transpeptidase ErfK/SrfK